MTKNAFKFIFQKSLVKICVLIDQIIDCVSGHSWFVLVSQKKFIQMFNDICISIENGSILQIQGILALTISLLVSSPQFRFPFSVRTTNLSNILTTCPQFLSVDQKAKLASTMRKFKGDYSKQFAK